MRRPTQRWKPARTGGSGAIPVEEVGNENNVGLAKSRGFQYEKLASDLARVVGVTVPPVEIDQIEGKDGLWAVSKAHGETSIDGFMGRVAEKELFNSSAVQVAFRAASGLVAFYTWIC